MKFNFLALLLFITSIAFSQNTKKININGFGELNAVQNGEVYSIKIADYGTFDFKGSISPISLETEVSIEQLEEFPGYDILSNLGLQDISLKMSGDGLEINANADTEKNLKSLCQMLNVSTPTVSIAAKVGKGTFDLSGELAFSQEPIKMLEIDKSGTELSYYSAGLGAAYAKGSFQLVVSLNLLVKPSKYDNDLKMNYLLGYDLVKQTLSGAATMNSTWTDPFGMDRFFNPNSVIFSNGASALAVNIPSTSISKFGFVIERAKFFNVDFGTFVSISPLDGEVALLGKSRSRISLNQIPDMLKQGFGLEVPNMFPSDYYLDSAEIKFAPTGGTVGLLELDKGFTLKGSGKFKELEGFLDFNFDLENDFYFEMDFEGDFKKFIMNEAHKLPEAASQIIEQALTEIQIQRMYLLMDAKKSNLTLNGKMTCEFKYQGKLQKITFEASLDAEEIAKNLANKLLDEFGGAVLDLAKKVGKDAGKIANKALGEADKLLAEAKTIKQHVGHSKNKCDTECVPKHAKTLSEPIVEASYIGIRKFYFNTIHELGKIKGSTPEQTRKMRSNLIKEEWDKIFVPIDKKWDEVLSDRTYVRMYAIPESATNGGEILRNEVQSYRKKDLDYRTKVWERMMTRDPKGKEYANLKGTEIPKGTYYIKSVKAGNSNNGYMDISYNHDKKKWKIKGQRLQIWTKDNSGAKKYKFHRNNYLSYYIITPSSDLHYALDCKGGKSDKRTPIHLWSLHKGGSQQFYFKHVGGGKFAIIPRRNHKMCLALKDNKNANKGNKVHLWTYSDTPSKQWYLINVKTGKKYIP
jgi:hypothetical protein